MLCRSESLDDGPHHQPILWSVEDPRPVACRGLALMQSGLIEQDGYRSGIASRRLVDQLLGDCLALGNCPAPAVLGHSDTGLQLLVQRSCEIPRAPRAAPRIA